MSKLARRIDETLFPKSSLKRAIRLLGPYAADVTEIRLARQLRVRRNSRPTGAYQPLEGALRKVPPEFEWLRLSGDCKRIAFDYQEDILQPPVDFGIGAS